MIDNCKPAWTSTIPQDETAQTRRLVLCCPSPACILSSLEVFSSGAFFPISGQSCWSFGRLGRGDVRTDFMDGNAAQMLQRRSSKHQCRQRLLENHNGMMDLSVKKECVQPVSIVSSGYLRSRQMLEMKSGLCV